MTTRKLSVTVIFDNGGGTTVQMSEGDCSWAHHYADAEQAAGDVRDALENGFGSFDGDEPEAAALVPTDNEIRNGGYRVERFESRDQLNDFAHANFESSWGNARRFAVDTLKRII